MGVTLSEDDQKDSSKAADMHLRALLTLEGRSPSPVSTTFGFAKVELPDFGSDSEKKPDQAVPSKSPFSLNNSIAGKRDSFGKLLTPASGSKKELQTLLEEDEGEDYVDESVSPMVPVPAPRHRPRSLNLRPVPFKPSVALPTPSPTPPLKAPKLKSLTLAPTAHISPPKRSSLLVSSHSTPLLSSAEVEQVRRQSSVSYKRPSESEAALPTPSVHIQVLTPSPSPTLDRHRRSISPTELLAQSTFLAQSHASFLVRIADLEAALSRATTPSPAFTDPSEEWLDMLADLKSERDQLKKSLDELRVHCDDQEKEIAVLGRRLDNERRDVWVTKEKLQLAEAEKQTLSKEKETLFEEASALKYKLQSLSSQLHAEKSARLKAEKELKEVLETPKLPPAPYPYPTSYRRSQASVDSEITDVEDHTITLDSAQAFKIKVIFVILLNLRKLIFLTGCSRRDEARPRGR